ncbi:MAG: YlbF family regulator [Gemmatimonadaceae bacterium]
MNLEEKARELGRMLGQSDQYKAVKKASEALHQDREASSILRQMEKLQLEAQQMMERGERPTPELEQQLDGLLQKVQVNRIYQDMVVSQENFDKIMLRVNQWILEGIRKGATSSIITLG